MAKLSQLAPPSTTIPLSSGSATITDATSATQTATSGTQSSLDTGTQTGFVPSYTPSYTPSSTSTTSTSGDTATPQPKSQSTQIIILGAVLGSLFGVFIVISLLLFYIRHRRRRSSRDTPNIGFNKEKMVSRRWWHSSHYSFRDAKKSQIDSEAASRSEYQSEWDDTFESLAPSDSVSQVQSKSKRNLNDKRTLPPLPSNNLSVVSEKVEA
uniref:Mid2 domain-containing protein n=1 Tax=Moniliophthora roreri TaxID=221103 RepID=A0A0W0FRC3_MONRR